MSGRLVILHEITLLIASGVGKTEKNVFAGERKGGSFIQNPNIVLSILILIFATKSLRARQLIWSIAYFLFVLVPY